MPPLSARKILFWIVLLCALSYGGQIGQYIYDSLEPLRACSREERYVLTLVFLALLYVSIYRIIKDHNS
jgi:hypothetical protein